MANNLMTNEVTSTFISSSNAGEADKQYAF